MIEIKPPKPVITKHYGSESRGYNKWIFLAGSIEMGKARHWQKEVVKMLKDYKVYIYNPRRDDWDSSQSNNIDNPYFREQVEWELLALDFSNFALMHFEPGTVSPISLLELGAFKEKMIVSCPDGYHRKGNVQITCEYFNIPMYHNLDYAVESLKAKLN